MENINTTFALPEWAIKELYDYSHEEDGSITPFIELVGLPKFEKVMSKNFQTERFPLEYIIGYLNPATTSCCLVISDEEYSRYKNKFVEIKLKEFLSIESVEGQVEFLQMKRERENL